MKSVAILAVSVLIVSGCLSSGEQHHVDMAGSVLRTPPNPCSLLPISFPATAAAIHSNTEKLTLFTRDGGAGTDSGVQTLHVRIIDGRGTAHDSAFEVPEMAPYEFARYEVTAPVDRPLPWIIAAECGCGIVWVDRMAGEIRLVDEHQLRETNAIVRVEYPDLAMPAGRPLGDHASFPLNENTVHWRFLWKVNLDGDVFLRSPIGNEVAHWRCEGHKVVDGHVSNGTRPLDVGDWTLEMEGHGWFELHLRVVNYISERGDEVQGGGASL